MWSWSVDSGLAATFEISDDEVAPYFSFIGVKSKGTPVAVEGALVFRRQNRL